LQKSFFGGKATFLTDTHIRHRHWEAVIPAGLTGISYILLCRFSLVGAVSRWI